MLCNMFLYVVQHVFRISANCIMCKYSGMIALFADACRKMHKMQKLAVVAENCPS